MRSRKALAVLAVLAMVAAACATTTTTTTTAQPEVTTTQAPQGTTTTAELMDELVFDFGFDEATGTIKVAALAAVTGPIAGIGNSLLAGHKLYWDSLNGNGGVAGMYPIELVVRDNEYNPTINVTVYDEIKDEILAISSAIGTPTTASIYEDAATNDILVMAGSGATQWAFTDNVLLNLSGAHYFAQFANAPYWAMNIADPAVITADSVVGIIYQADDYGAECLNGYNFAQANLGFNAGYEATYASGDSDFSAQVGGAAAAGVTVLFACVTPSVLAGLLGTALALQYSPAVFGSSPAYISVLPGALGAGDEAAGLAAFNSFPYYHLGGAPTFEDETPGMQLLRENLDTYGADIPAELLTWFFWFGYSQAQTMHQILEVAVANHDISRAGLLAAVDMVKDVDMGYGEGLVGYGPSVLERIPSNLDTVAVPVSVTEKVFGLNVIQEPYEAPYMADWDPTAG